ncbi:uncharacterized protein LOC117303110 [Asterias rubens]|uniref:uncharacterized protein LOC117303110 n=1 Tax=Asterias rubens TaxID=7604 RepID=UPI001455C75D|nr:uncharacterized protein LOC117303110 [Asterias rubens]
MYWQQQQQSQQQQGSRYGRQSSNNMSQSPPGWGSPTNSNLPSLLDMSGNLRRSEPLLRTPEYGNRGPPSRSTGLLESPPMAYQKTQQDMLGQLDSGIDELVAAKVRIQQAMLAASADTYDHPPTSPTFQQHSRPQSTPNRQQNQNQWRQQVTPQYQDKRRSSGGGQMGRNTGGGGARGGNDGRRSGPGSGGRDNRGSGGVGQNRGQSSAKKRRNSSEAYDPARPTEDDRGFTSIGRPVDDLQVTIKQQSRGRAVVDDAGPARKKPMQGPRSGSKPTQQSSVENDSNKSAWFCHVCRVSCHNIKVYQIHMKSDKHLTAMEKITEVATFQSGQARKRLEAQQFLRNLEGGGAKGGGGPSPSGDREKFCRDCHKYFRGDRFDHLKSEAHKEAKRQSIPRCSACNMTFKTSQKYVQHCKGDMHKLKRDQQLKEKDEAAGDGNYVTVDAVGFDDDMEFGADFLEMELGTGDGSPEREDEEDEVVIISGDEKECLVVGDNDSVVVVEDDSSVNPDPDKSIQSPKGQSGSEPEVQEVSDQVLVSGPDVEPSEKPVDEPSVKPVDGPSDKPVDEPSTGDTVPLVEEATSNVKLLEGSEMELRPAQDDSKVEETFYPKKLVEPDLQSATDGYSASSEVANSSQSESNKSYGEATAILAVAHQDVTDNQTGSGFSGQSEGKESSDMVVDAVPTASAASDQLQDASDQQQQETQQQQNKPPQQEETTELVFDPNKPVGEVYLVPVSGFFCKLCHKFLTSDKAGRAHCKGKLHFKALKEELKKKDADQYSADDSDQVSN